MEDKLKGKNRRSSFRQDTAFTLNYGIEQPYSLRAKLGLRDDLEALMLDLSETGMAMVTAVELPRGAQLHIKFNFINLFLYGQERTRRMELSAKVISHAELDNGDYRIGVSFNKISPEDKEAIKDFIRRSK
jgi:c-di-GMP-binding flagellar brake protein YcgR